VGVAPIATARGIQNKVLEAISAGLPVVVTSAVDHGLPGEVAGAYCVADSANDFSGEIVRLFKLSSTERNALAGAARLEPLKWSARLSEVPEICRAAARRS